MTRKQTTSIMLLVASVIYAMIPTDLIPDVPIVGWLDDTLVTSSAAINCLQQFSDGDNEVAQRIMKWLKWTCLLLAVLIILVVILLANVLISIFR